MRLFSRRHHEETVRVLERSRQVQEDLERTIERLNGFVAALQSEINPGEDTEREHGR